MMIKNPKDLQKDIYGRLAPYAVKETKGRTYPHSESLTRLPFQIDRDRIIHCKAFRRLDEKTQVLTANYGDHYRTRLTHTIEVAQIARDIARSFSLNEDLAEAIALAHDLGHTPFSHAGQDALNEIMQSFGRHFEHNEQSRRVVEKLEKLYPDFDGLNLTIEVLDGLIKHRSYWDSPKEDLHALSSLEAEVVNLSDEIAYTHHDIDDGIRSGLFKLCDLDGLILWQKAKEHVIEKYKNPLSDEIAKARITGAMIHLMILDLAKNSSDKGIRFSDGMKSELSAVHNFLSNNFYFTDMVQGQLNEGRKIIRELFDYYYRRDKDEIAVKDYIAGMTDGFAKSEHARLVKREGSS